MWTLGEGRVPEATVPPGSARGRGVSSAPQCSSRTPVHGGMDDPDLLAGAVEHLLHAALLSGPEPAKTLPVYDSASHADPSRLWRERLRR